MSILSLHFYCYGSSFCLVFGDFPYLEVELTVLLTRKKKNVQFCEIHLACGLFLAHKKFNLKENKVIQKSQPLILL